MDKASKQKYNEASEQDKKRYKEEVGEMVLKAKPVKNQQKKKLLKNAKNLEKTLDDLINHSANLPNGLVSKRQVVEDEVSGTKNGKILKFPYGFALELSAADSRKDLMAQASLPKLENKMSSIFFSEEIQASPGDMSLETDVFPKIEHIDEQIPSAQEPANLKNQPSLPKRNNSFFEFLNFGAKNSLIFPKNSEVLPKLPSFQFSFLEKNMSNNERENSKAELSSENEEKQTSKGRNFLNGVLESALDSDFSLNILSDLMKFSHSFMVTNQFVYQF